MPTLRMNASIADLQDYVASVESERGFSEEDVIRKCLLLGEEVGELYKAVRNASGMAIDPRSAVGEVADELADVFILLLAIANRFGVNVEDAVREKDRRSLGRVWNRGREPRG